MSKLIKKKDGSFHRLPDEEADELIASGKAQEYDLTKGLQEPPKHKAIFEPKKTKKKGK